MKSLFPGYYKPTNSEFIELWANCIFIPDANVLLKVYGYSTHAREQLLGLLESISDRLWIPYEFAHEYQRNRAKCIMREVKHCKDVVKTLRGVLANDFNSRSKHPFISEELLAAYQNLCSVLEKEVETHIALFSEDPIHHRISSLFDGKVGQPFSSKDRDEHQKRGKARYDLRIPPGYMDLKKKPDDPFGDFLGWQQILEYSKSLDKPVIFITNDSKEDWWNIREDRTIGPRPELIEEFLSFSNNNFYMYSSDNFLRFAKQYLLHDIDDEVIDELREIRKRQTDDFKKSMPSDSDKMAVPILIKTVIPQSIDTSYSSQNKSAPLQDSLSSDEDKSSGPTTDDIPSNPGDKLPAKSKTTEGKQSNESSSKKETTAKKRTRKKKSDG